MQLCPRVAGWLVVDVPCYRYSPWRQGRTAPLPITSPPRNPRPGPHRQLLHQLLRRNPVERITFEELFAHPFLQQVGAWASTACALRTAVRDC